MTRDDTIYGCLLGGAIGDALGGPYEGQPPGALVQIDVAEEDDDAELGLSDDTQLTLATCEAIVEQRGVDAACIAAAMARWYREGRVTGLGGATAEALSELVRGGPLLGNRALVGRKGEMAAGNGAAMRIAPLAFWLDGQADGDRRLIRDICRITHHNDEAYVGALAVVVAIRAVVDGRWSGGDGLLALVAEALPESRVKERLVALAEEAPGLELLEIAARFGCSGYVVESVPFALTAAQKLGAVDFELMIDRVISCGGDADTNAAMAGQIAGAYWGRTRLPAGLLAKVAHRGEIEGIVKLFVEVTRSIP